MYLYALAAAGQPGVEKALGNMRTEIADGCQERLAAEQKYVALPTPTDVN